MSLRAAAAGLCSAAGVRRPLPAVTLVQAASEKIDGEARMLAKPPVDLDAVAARLSEVLAGGQVPQRRDLRYAAWCVWETRPALAEAPEALARYLDLIAHSRRRLDLRRLASSYLSAYTQAGRPGLDAVARTLAAGAAQSGPPWADLHRGFGIFDRPNGVSRIVRAALDRRGTVPELLREHGLGALAAESGFAQAAFLEGLHTLGRTEPRDARSRLEAIRAWCLKPDGTLVHTQYAAQLIDALVLPYAGVNLPKRDRDQLLAFLLGLFGDPRVRPEKWISAEQSAAIVRRWLTEQTLRQFFDVVDRIARPEHWNYRRAFWEAVYTQGLILDACVVFDQQGERVARQAFGRDASFATFRGGGSKQIQDGHTVLLLAVGSGVIAEWSHSGSCNVWHDKTDRTAPRLHAGPYDSDQLRRPLPRRRTAERLAEQGIFNHTGSPSYLWQRRVADCIFDMTGVRVPQSQYQVR